MFASRRVNDGDQGISHPRVAAASGNVHVLAGRVVRRIIRPDDEFDGFDELVSLTAQDLARAVRAVRDENLIGLRVINDGAGPSGLTDGADPLASSQIQDFNRAVLLGGNEEPLPLNVDSHMVQRSIDSRQGNVLEKLQRGRSCLVLRGARHGRDGENGEDYREHGAQLLHVFLSCRNRSYGWGSKTRTT